MFRNIRRVVCGISGGVDSAVSALLLKKKGYEVIGLFMTNWDKLNEKGECQADKDFEDAQFICEHLNLPLHNVSFVKEYWNEVFSQFLEDHKNGLSSVPDIYCNRYIKFGEFFDTARNEFNADAIATGHYARTSIEHDMENADLSKGVKLLRGLDPVKDQTFFLAQIPQKTLERTIFPVGSMLKKDVKKIAIESGLERIAKKKESMGLCYIGKTNFSKFIENYIEPKVGYFVDLETEEIIGEHDGLHKWTIGQRINIGSRNMKTYVASKDSASNNIMVVEGTNHPALFCQSAVTQKPYWICGPPEGLSQYQPVDVLFKYQHVHPVSKCTLSLNPDDTLTICTPEPMRAFTPGQFFVFYNGEECIGCARTHRSGPSLYHQEKRDRVDLRIPFT
ncbi:mitochondrial tRNA-specific 2-thiouridylase 1-like [Mizuhopecten yessoensis]|uniref:tRNA-5-taurinomethyluridine 2-sulfurtransferase n=1 Tax=Mizuhopecten yessoensis TaxID=6573 RepID=A0A210PI17_MIZYE|nr:mitochondrial tRNA-specific 2-thiouridylase 1-like [Mizuhopecten yessoensis]OWF36117.1 Mitochondrial tRNA-specific 2-thiouridylase 1 [Mizuhopecten yessoensis]